ncbi:MAG: hypothetical protein FJY29_12600 [Betaproteobacteria bacterium]|nr:hypothetical protein [Betaproteobacteria bacterium]
MLLRMLILLISFFVFCFFSNTGFADCRGIGVLVLRSSAVNAEVYEPYLQNDCLREANLFFAEVDYNPVTANQIRDLQTIVTVAREAAKTSSRGLVVFAYSEAGKFAVKLASLDSNVRALFLMDPVDGTPPFSSPRRFPVFLDGSFPPLRVPTTILESELGSQFKRLGYSCVPEDMGPKHFYLHVDPEFLNRVLLDDLGHSDFVRMKKMTLVEWMCGKGIIPREQALGRIIKIWEDFLMQSAL